MGAIYTLVLLLVLPLAAAAQTITTGTLSGAVTTVNGDSLADVSVTVSSSQGGAARNVMSGYEGGFRIPLLAAGLYNVLVEHLGYRPKLIEGVPVMPGRDVRVDVSLVAAPPPIEAPERVRYGGTAGGSRAGVSQSVSVIRLDHQPWERRETSELAALASRSNEYFEVEGLPGSLSTVTVDGLPYATARHPGITTQMPREAALPVNVLQSGELVTADPDVEWSGFAGGTLGVLTRPGGSEFGIDAFGAWSGAALHTSKFIETGDLTNNSVWGGALISGPIVRDTAHFVLGFEARKLDTPFARGWQVDPALDAALVDVAHTSYNLGLEPFTRSFLLQSNVVSGFGRFDWQVSNDNALSVRAGFGQISEASGDVGVVSALLPGLTGNGNDLYLAASLTSRIRTTWAHEVRAGLLKSTRDFGDTESAAVLPFTRIVAGANTFGSDARAPGQFERTDLSLLQSLQIPSSAHQLKIGLALQASMFDDTYNYASAGSFAFGNASDFAAKRGSFLQTSVTGAANSSFDLLKIGGFVQDVWYATPALRVTAGLRYDMTSLPQGDITPNDPWFAATGIRNDSIEENVGVLSPRFNLTWDLDGRGSWVVSATAGRYVSDVDPAIFDEVLLADGDLKVQRIFGDLNGWPTPSGSNLPATRPTLTMLAPSFSSPQTDRVSFGLSRGSGGTTIQFSGTYRSTEFLARRSDLNLFTAPSARDQHGRPLFGTLAKSGELVGVAQPNRRFSEFDAVYALSADGWSHYWGITGAVERALTTNLGFFASYTYSQTTDNWLAGASGNGMQSQLSPFPDDATDAWREGTSDFDLPHRMSAGLDLRLGGAVQPHITALYRYRSGYPFTPGFRDGVDINGDGASGNDPAYIDTNITGTSELVSSWGCLRSQTGRFAERNSCREDAVHSLNLRVGLTLLRSAAIVVEGLNLIESSQAQVDRALYLIDRNTSLTTDQAQGKVTVPLVANPHFGEPLVRFGTGRVLRIGLQLNY